MESLILDLRGNPGGLLDQAVRVCDQFLPANKLIVSTEGRGLNETESYYSARRERHPELKMVILVDGASASASEIVAGCLQDSKRAIIVGEQTFGKGSVQKIIPLKDGSALRLTTSRYYTPSHKVIHGTGITPDIEVTMTDEEQQALFLQRMPGGLENLHVILDEMDVKTRERFRFLAKHVRDRQLDRATDLLKGIQLFSKRQNGQYAATAGK
jgi:carboxyl-terminal processing protease